MPTPATPTPACFVCRKHRGEIAGAGGPVFEDDLLYVGHVQIRAGHASAYLGHLLVEPKRHAPGLTDLTDEEAAALGTTVARVSRGLRERLCAEHVYAFVLGDAVPHLLVHVVPRYAGAPREFWGVRVDEWPDAPRGGVEEIEALCADLRAALAAPPPPGLGGGLRPGSPLVGSARNGPSAAHFILYVRDQERARAFYEAALGATPRLHVPGMTEFELPGGAVLGLMPESGIRRLLPSLPDPALACSGARAETYLVVASPSEALERALAAGATELSPVLPRDWGVDAGYCLDPEGHVLAFAAPRAALPGVALHPFDRERDLGLVSAWVERLDVRRWWGDPRVALAELSDRAPETAAIVSWDDRPVGVLCWQTPTRAELEDAGLADLPADLIDVDVLVGEPKARGRGVAPAALRLLCARLGDEGVRWVGLGTALANSAALAAYAKAGFVPYRDFVENGEAYRYFTCDLASGG